MYYIKPQIIVGSFSSFINDIRGKKVLALASPSVAKNNNLENSLKALETSDCTYIFISDIKPENPFSYIKTVYERLTFQPDIIIAAGGGSVLDLAKAISVSATYDEMRNNFYGINKELKKYAEVIAFPTTFGSGAESSFAAILYDDEKKEKNGIRGEKVQPDKIVIDFSLYHSAPKRIKALSAFDCLTHCVETYISTKSDALVKYNSVKSLQTIFDNMESAVLYNESAVVKNENATKNMAFAAMFMGFNLAFSSTCMPHRIQYVIGPATGTSHAEGLTALYRGWLKHITMNDGAGHGAFSDLACELSLTPLELKTKIDALKKNTGIDYGLSDFGIKERDLAGIVDGTSGNLSVDPYYHDKSSLEAVVRLSL
jgi:alcohol dehydrogenase class IV